MAYSGGSDVNRCGSASRSHAAPMRLASTSSKWSEAERPGIIVSAAWSAATMAAHSRRKRSPLRRPSTRQSAWAPVDIRYAQGSLIGARRSSFSDNLDCTPVPPGPVPGRSLRAAYPLIIGAPTHGRVRRGVCNVKMFPLRAMRDVRRIMSDHGNVRLHAPQYREQTSFPLPVLGWGCCNQSQGNDGQGAKH
jgi:hypothetical protein